MARYEFPLQERTRNLLRLESVFAGLDDTPDPRNLRSHLRAFLELLDFCQRPELRLDLILELERLLQTLQLWAKSPEADHAALTHWQEECRGQLQQLREMPRALGESLRHQEILQLARGRMAVAGGLADCDIPLLALWQQQSPELIAERLQRWRAELIVLERSVALILAFLRESQAWSLERSRGGRFALPLNPRQPVVLATVVVEDDGSGAYPKLSGGAHRLHVQFLQWLDPGPSRALESDLSFRLGLSAC
ncbi:MAG: cell division protein ZapD [Acidithiobacillus sp.]|uniref:cell division protein ZapD n=1 Tax=Acidithiobacillus sp. TaxID=1872118 RepID=UPI003D01C76E